MPTRKSGYDLALSAGYSLAVASCENLCEPQFRAQVDHQA